MTDSGYTSAAASQPMSTATQSSAGTSLAQIPDYRAAQQRRCMQAQAKGLLNAQCTCSLGQISCRGGGLRGHASIPTPLGRRAVPAHKGQPADGLVKARIASIEAGIQATQARDRPQSALQRREEDDHPDRRGSGSLPDGHGRCSDAAPVHTVQPSSGPTLGKGDVSFPVSLEAALSGHADLPSVHALTLLVQRWSVSPPWTLELEWPKAPTKSSALALLDHVPWKAWEPPSSPIELFIYADGSVMRNSHGAAFVVFTQEPGGLWVFHGCSRFRDQEQVTQGLAGTHSTSMESLALSLAMLWGLHLPRGSQVHLLSDGDSSVRAALGLTALPRACADQACIFATLSRSLFLLTEARGHCWHVQHVKGHSQHPANELVDAFARSVCADDFCNRVEIHSAISSLCQAPDRECCPTAAGTRPFLPFGRFAVVWPRHRFLGTFLSLFLSSSHVAGNRLRLRLPVDTRSASQPHLSMRRP